MSLINEALKKAQQERSRQQASLARPQGGSEATPSSFRPVPIQAPPPLPVFRIIIGLIIGGSALASAVAFMIFLYMQVRTPVSPVEELERRESAPVNLRPVVTSPGNPESVEVLLPDELPVLPANRVSSPPPVETIAPPAPEPETIVPAATRPEPANPPVTSNEPVPADELIPPVSSPDPALAGSPKDPAYPNRQSELAAQRPPTGPPPDHDDRVSNYLREMSVSGIRLSGPDSKVVLNNRVYRLKDTVLDTDLNLIIVGIEPSLIHFQDEYGKRHTKRF